MSRASPASAGRDDLTIELAATAARLIAEDGCDYATAKRKAAQLVFGSAAPPRGRLLPDNDLVEAQLRSYLRTFGGEQHARLLADLRALALGLMDYLADFNPHLVGAVLNGTAPEHSAVHQHQFTDSAKDVEMRLLDDGVRFEVGEGDPAAGELETIRMQVPRRMRGATSGAEAMLSVLHTDALRVAARFRSTDPTLTPIERSGRAAAPALRALLAGGA